MSLSLECVVELFAIAGSHRYLLFCGEAPPEIKASNRFRLFTDGNGDWRTEQAWIGNLAERLRPQSGEVPVFAAALGAIPDAALKALAAWGLERTFVWDGDAWLGIPLDPIGLARYLDRLGRWRARQDVLLRRHATPIAPSEMQWAEVSPWHIHVPHLREFSDCNEATTRSPLMVFEDGQPLGPAHSAHADIMTAGCGRFSHWGDYLYFSARDNSAPSGNSRAYCYALPQAWQYEEFRAAFSSKGLGGPARPPSLAEVLAYHAAPSPVANPHSIALVIGTLGAGGAERQICNLAVGLQELGWHVTLLVLFPLEGESRYYVDLLARRWSFDIVSVGGLVPESDPAVLAEQARMLVHLPQELWGMTLRMAATLQKLRPSRLVCYLDLSNIVGGIAGIVAGVPRIMICARSLAPHHFPHIYRDWMPDLYRGILDCPRVSLAANSHAGAHSYAEWLDLPPGQICVINNGIRADSFETPPEEATRALRAQLGIPPSAPVIAGILRFTFEKRPLFFIQVIGRVKELVPTVHAIIAGTGAMHSEVEAEIQRLGLGETVHLLGRRDDIPCVVQASDLLLHISGFEGFPNAVMEAQWLGRPVVCTRVGGMLEALAPHLHRFARGADNLDGLAQSCADILANPNEAKRLGQIAQEDSRLRFSAALMVRETLSVLDHPLSGDAPIQQMGSLRGLLTSLLLLVVAPFVHLVRRGRL